MRTVAVILNDSAHAGQVLAPLLQSSADTHWILVAVAPTLTRHMGRWMSATARRQSLERWSDALFADLAPLFGQSPGHRVERLVVRRSWQEVEARLRAQHAALQVVEARRPRDGIGTTPGHVPPRTDDRSLGAWLSSLGVGTLLAMAD